MKWLKNIIVSILILVLTSLISLLAISLNLKSILVNGIIKETVKTQVQLKPHQEENKIITEETIKQVTDDEQIQELLNTKEIQDLMYKYLDITIDGLIDEEAINEIEIEKDILEYLKENKSEIEKVVGQEIEEDMIKQTEKQMETKDITKSYKQSINNARMRMTTTEKSILKGYKTLVSIKLKIIVIIFIIIIAIILAIIQKSLEKWLKNIGNSSIMSGILIIVMSITVNLVVNKIANLNSFQTTNLLFTGIMILIIGLLFLIGSKIIKNIKEAKNAVS